MFRKQAEIGINITLQAAHIALAQEELKKCSVCVSFYFVLIVSFLFYAFHLVQFIALQMLPFQKFTMVPLHFAQLANGVLQPVEHLGGRVEVDEVAALPLTSSSVFPVSNVNVDDEVCTEAECEGCDLADKVEKVCDSVRPAERVCEQKTPDQSDDETYVHETLQCVPCTSDKDEDVSVFVHHACVFNEDLYDDDDFGTDVSDEVVPPVPFEYHNSCDESESNQDFCDDLDFDVHDEVMEPGSFEDQDSCDEAFSEGASMQGMMTEQCDKTGGVMPAQVKATRENVPSWCVEIEDLGDEESSCVTDGPGIDLFPHGNPAFELCSCSVSVTDCSSLLQNGVYVVNMPQKKGSIIVHGQCIMLAIQSSLFVETSHAVSATSAFAISTHSKVIV